MPFLAPVGAAIVGGRSVSIELTSLAEPVGARAEDELPTLLVTAAHLVVRYFAFLADDADDSPRAVAVGSSGGGGASARSARFRAFEVIASSTNPYTPSTAAKINSMKGPMPAHGLDSSPHPSPGSFRGRSFHCEQDYAHKNRCDAHEEQQHRK